MYGFRGRKHSYVSCSSGVFFLPRSLVTPNGTVTRFGAVALRLLVTMGKSKKP